MTTLVQSFHLGLPLKQRSGTELGQILLARVSSTSALEMRSLKNTALLTILMAYKPFETGYNFFLSTSAYSTNNVDKKGISYPFLVKYGNPLSK